MQAVILAGGFGTRLKEAVPDLPKPLAPINGRPFLDILLDQLGQIKEIDKVVLAIGYKAEAIVRHCSADYPFELDFSIEDKPLGTGGALKQALNLIDSSDVLVMNGDSYLDFSFDKLQKEHEKRGANVTLGALRIEKADRYGFLSVDETTGEILSFSEKKEGVSSGFINGGVYLVKKDLFSPFEEVFSLEKDFFPRIINRFACIFDGAFIDIGTPDSFTQAQEVLRCISS